MTTENVYRERGSLWGKKVVPWVALVVVLGSAAAYFTTQSHVKNAQASANVVRWLSVQKGNVLQTVGLSGTLSPANEVSLAGQGKLVSVSVKVGDKVTKGQKVAQLDTTAYTAQLQQAEAQLQITQAKLAQAQQPVSMPGGKAQSPDPNAVLLAQASLNSAQAQVTSIQQQINACTLTSPISGTVLQVESPLQSQGSAATGSGQSSGSGNVIAVIADLNPADFVVQANVDQTDAANVHTGQSAQVSLTSSGGTRLTGKVTSIGYMPQTQSGVTTYPVTIQLDAPQNPNITLLPGQDVTVSVTETQANGVLTLPTAALTQRRGTTGVYIKSDASSSNSRGSGMPAGLQFQPVTVGLYGGNVVEIRSGLTEGEQVAVVLPTSTTGTNPQQASRGFGGMGGFGGMQGAFGGNGGRSGRSGGGNGGGGGNS